MTMSVILGLMIPFVGTTLGSAVVFFMKRSLSVNVSRALTGFAAGVFYSFKTEDVKKLFCAMANRFGGAVLAFDACNKRGAKMMMKTWL